MAAPKTDYPALVPGGVYRRDREDGGHEYAFCITMTVEMVTRGPTKVPRPVAFIVFPDRAGVPVRVYEEDREMKGWNLLSAPSESAARAAERKYRDLVK